MNIKDPFENEKLSTIMDLAGLTDLKNALIDWITYEQVDTLHEVEDLTQHTRLKGINWDKIKIENTPGGGIMAFNDNNNSVVLMHNGCGIVSNAPEQTVYLTNGVFSLTLGPDGLQTDAVIYAADFIKKPVEVSNPYG